MSTKTLTMESPFRVAMLKYAAKARNLGRFGAQINQAVQHNAGIKAVPAWNAHLSFRTYNQLKAKGIMV